jgi:regulatory protein
MRLTKTPTEPYNYERALGYALWLLGRRAYSRMEVQRKLLTKTDEATTQAVLERIDDLNLVDDAAYAKRLIETQKQRKGELALKQTLIQRGVPAQVIDANLAAVSEQEQVTVAKTLLEKHRWRFRGDEHAKRRKAYAFLARRGFPLEVVNEALETL